MKQSYYFFILLIFTNCGASHIAKKQAVVMTKAIVSNNYEITLKYTHPNVVKLAGSENNFIEVLKSGTDEMKMMGNQYQSIQIGKPSKFVKAQNELHCLIPETINMQLKEGKMKNKSYLLAVSVDNGKSWTFIETAILNDKNLYTLLPNYNKELVIPKMEKPQYFK